MKAELSWLFVFSFTYLRQTKENHYKDITNTIKKSNQILTCEQMNKGKPTLQQYIHPNRTAVRQCN